jgi:hypothetical protein
LRKHDLRTEHRPFIQRVHCPAGRDCGQDQLLRPQALAPRGGAGGPSEFVLDRRQPPTQAARHRRADRWSKREEWRGTFRSAQLAGGLGEHDIHAALAPALALQQELQGERRLAGARRALDQVEAIAGQATGEDVIEAEDAG